MAISSALSMHTQSLHTLLSGDCLSGWTQTATEHKGGRDWFTLLNPADKMERSYILLNRATFGSNRILTFLRILCITISQHIQLAVFGKETVSLLYQSRGSPAQNRGLPEGSKIEFAKTHALSTRSGFHTFLYWFRVSCRQMPVRVALLVHYDS